MPERLCPLHFLSALLNSCYSFPCDCFPCVMGNNRCFESKTQQNASQICQVQEERDCIPGTFLFHSLSAAKSISSTLFSCWKPSIGDITAIKLQKKKKGEREEDNLQQADLDLNQSVVMFWDLLTIQRASPLKSKQISKVAHPCKASPLLYQVINSHCLLKFPLCLAVAGHKVECSRRANSMDTAWASLTAETGMPGLKGAEVLT